MSLLLDTHALVWWLNDDPALGRAADVAIRNEDQQILVSAVSAMEVTTKYRLGKMPEAAGLALDFISVCKAERFELLPITVEHAALAGSLAIPHKDPFDRLLIAQAQAEALWLVSNETLFDGFGVRRLW